MTDVLKHVIRSVQPPGMWDRFYEKVFFPARNWTRRQRKTLPENVRNATEKIYRFFRIFWFSFRPFLGASALYFDIFKDIAIVVMITTSLRDLTKENFVGNPDMVLENLLLFSLIAAIVLVQVRSNFAHQHGRVFFIVRFKWHVCKILYTMNNVQ